MTTGRVLPAPVPFTVRSVMSVGSLVGGSIVGAGGGVKSVLKVTPVELSDRLSATSV